MWGERMTVEFKADSNNKKGVKLLVNGKDFHLSRMMNITIKLSAATEEPYLSVIADNGSNRKIEVTDYE